MLQKSSNAVVQVVAAETVMEHVTADVTVLVRVVVIQAVWVLVAVRALQAVLVVEG